MRKTYRKTKKRRSGREGTEGEQQSDMRSSRGKETVSRTEGRGRIVRRAGKKRGRAVLSAVLAALLLLTFAACTDSSKEGNGSTDEGFTGKTEEPVEVSILCVGDVMAHSTNIRAAQNAAGGSGYDFTDNYEYVKPYISGADLALCNVETTFAGTEPSGYPLFCAPDELAYALMDAGFDVGITSNNHMMDTGFDGMQRTLKVLRNQGLIKVGSRYAGEDRWSIAEVNGVKIGLVAYTYETTGADSDGVTINGNYVSKESEELINSFNLNELDEDIDRIASDIEGAEEAGADIVVCYMHWGNEYQRTPDENQIYMAQALADRGADIIFASHPHVLQKADILKSEDGRDVPVFYSMGNFISNQRYETLNQNRYTEQGMMAQVTVEVLPGTGEIVEETVQVIPTWVDRYGSPYRYAIIPLDSDLQTNPVLAASGHLGRAQQALQDVTELIGAEYLSGTAA